MAALPPAERDLLRPLPRDRSLPPGVHEITDWHRWQCLIFRITFCAVVCLLTVGNAVLCSLPLFYDDIPAPTPPAALSVVNNASRHARESDDRGSVLLGIFLPIVLRFTPEDLEAIGVMAQIRRGKVK